ncbi:ankyrin [Schizophyllum commune Loenen D]|nr:ankyrin [Schizophyllum commune Loenen D]
MRFLIKGGADVCDVSNDGNTLLHFLCHSLSPLAREEDPSLKLLLENGADIDAQDRDGRTCLHIAAMRAEYPLMACAKLLVTSGAVIDKHDNELRTPLHYATRRGLSLARYLIEQGADVFARDSSGSMALDDIAGCGWPDVQPLLDEVAARDPRFLARALLCAVRRGNIEIARYLMGRGASARGDRELPWAPICLAAIYGPLSMVRLLIDNGADIDHGQGIGNMAAIHAAAAVGYVSIVRLLVEHGARVNDVLDGGWTALHLAAMADRGNFEPYSNFVLHQYSPKAKIWKDTIHVLLDAGADLNAETEEGWKPIDVALDRKIRRLLYQQQKCDFMDRPVDLECCLADAQVLKDAVDRGGECPRSPRFYEVRRKYEEVRRL